MKIDKNMAVSIEKKALEEICRHYFIKRLAIFGSAVRGELGPTSDIDLLVEYDPAHRPNMVELQEIEDRLSALTAAKSIWLIPSI